MKQSLQVIIAFMVWALHFFSFFPPLFLPFLDARTDFLNPKQYLFSDFFQHLYPKQYAFCIYFYLSHILYIYK